VRKNRWATTVMAGIAVLALAFAAPVVASQGQPQPPKEPAPIQGDLVKVDTDKKMLIVKVADGAETEFQYNDSTEITGAKGAAGLATAKDSRVTVHFKEDAQTKTKLATRIIVQPKK
jgi:hypothetical protein